MLVSHLEHTCSVRFSLNIRNTTNFYLHDLRSCIRSESSRAFPEESDVSKLSHAGLDTKNLGQSTQKQE